MGRFIAILVALLIGQTAVFAQPDWGVYADGTTLYFYTTTLTTGDVPATPAAETIAVYKDGSATELTTGATIDDDWDTVVGFHQIAIDTTQAGFDTGSRYSVIYNAGTVNAVSIVGRVIGSFRLGAEPANVTQLLGTAWLTPAVAGTPDVNAKQISGDATAADNAEKFFDGTGYGVHPYRTTIASTISQTQLYIAGNSETDNALKGYTVTISDATSGEEGGPASSTRTIASSDYDAAVTTIFLESAPDFMVGDGDTLVFLPPGFAAADRTAAAAVKTKTDFLPSATAGAANGLFIAGTNASTTISGALTINNPSGTALNVVSSTGTAASFAGAGAAGYGIISQGSGSADGLFVQGGATGDGLKAVGGATGGDAMELDGDDTGDDFKLTGSDSPTLTNIIWDELKANHVVANSFGDFLDDEISQVGGGVTPIATGTAQAGTSTTIQLAAAHTFGDDILNGDVVTLLTNTGAGQSRVIADYVGATDTATVTPAWITNPGATSTYQVTDGSVNLTAVNSQPATLVTVGVGEVVIDNEPIVAARVAKLGTRADSVTVAYPGQKIRIGEVLPYWIDTSRITGNVWLSSVTNAVSSNAAAVAIVADAGVPRVGVNRDHAVVWLQGVAAGTAVITMDVTPKGGQTVKAKVTVTVAVD